ncbi:MAG: hypothetical protein IJX14_09420, partial [Clostridia bacterium]|nr:hypothetical protein [Clostridia bacterium]
MQIEPLEQWIWLPADKYPDNQTTTRTCMSGEDQKKEGHYTVVVCRRPYKFDKPIESVHIRTSGDTFFRLYVNDIRRVTGPASAGGDFLSNERVRPQHYAAEVTLDRDFPGLSEGRLFFHAVVRMQSIRMFEFSQGRGGFFLTAHVRFADGTKTVLVTDESWKIGLLSGHTAAGQYDGTIPVSEPVQAKRITNVWHCLTSPLPSAAETVIAPENNIIRIPAGETVDIILPMDRIYTGYPAVDVTAEGPVEVELRCIETDEGGSAEHYIFDKPDSYLGFTLHSAGKIRIKAENKSDSPAVLEVTFHASHYPVDVQAVTRTSDPDLDLVLDVCAHTLKYCRQTLHLDSGRHCEPMACTGDYYIESLMTAFTFGDMRLAAFDVRRTAQLLRYNDGRMFHTTYSLIWVQMLWDVYMLTGERELLADCEDALTILLERFATYLGENGIIENPPDYMFIDWLFPDEISTHHPPKALGQTCLNLFYYGALRTAAKIYDLLNEPAMSRKMDADAGTIQPKICEILYDAEKGLFFEGLNTPTPEHLLYYYMPQNVEKRYYRKHANILAAYFGIMDKPTCQAILEKVMTDESLGEIQPYFAHFLLDAIYRNGLRDQYTLQILEDWKAPVKECPCGLADGFIKPEPTYSFDHSHAWGGTPAYALPLALTGLELLEPGYKKI